MTDESTLTDDLTVRTIEQRIRIAASPATLWSFWTDAEKLCSWWGMSADVEAETGGLVRIVMGPDGPVMSGRYVDLDPFNRLVFTFGWEGNAHGTELAPGSTVVEVTFTSLGADTELVLRHTGVPAPNRDEHAKGWALFFGERLAVAVAASTTEQAARAVSGEG